MHMTARVWLLFLLIVLFPLPSFAVPVGPYTGTVLDSRTGDPIDGASVLMFWVKAVPGSFEGPRYAPIKTALTYTGRDGKYSIAKFNADVGLLGVFESTHILIYQPGYEAYIMKVCHAGPYCEKNEQFKDKNNLARLDRIPPGFNHEKHSEKIKDALRYNLESYAYFPEKGAEMRWKELVDRNTLIVPDREEFLRRTEWEERRKSRQ